MDALSLIVLALLQGITEFLPISSSGHLILVPQLLGWGDQGLAFDIAVHVGSLLAVLTYFRRDLVTLIRAWAGSLAGRHSAASTLAWGLILATLPAVVVGFWFKPWVETVGRSPELIAATTAGFGVLLWLADRFGRRLRELEGFGLGPMFVVGLAQVLALVPGTSRSGITMTAGLALGLTRTAAARFSFLLSIPVIAGAGTLQTAELVASDAVVDWTTLAVATALSAVAAFACIHLFLAWIQRIGMAPFAVYRVALGAVIYLYLVA